MEARSLNITDQPKPWPGHASLTTTMRYARADIDLKRQALSQVFPETLAPPRAGRLLINGADLIGWLRRT